MEKQEVFVGPLNERQDSQVLISVKNPSLTNSWKEIDFLQVALTRESVKHLQGELTKMDL